jgi:hypothetical protein
VAARTATRTTPPEVMVLNVWMLPNGVRLSCGAKLE